MTKKELIKVLSGASDDAEILVNIKKSSCKREGNRISGVKTGVYFPNAQIPEKVEITI